MIDKDDRLRDLVCKSQRRANCDAADFETVFRAAERQLSAQRRRPYVGFAATAILAALVLNLMPRGEPEFTYVDLNDLSATTAWTAPSDALLPDRKIDIYREIPRLFESTESATGALL